MWWYVIRASGLAAWALAAASVLAGLGMSASSLAVVLNALRLRIERRA